jgi:SET and MYND domain-containing protein 4
LHANRSAVLYHQTHYDEALKEIERAIDAGYPKELMYKLKERKARCMLAQKNHVEALEAFKEDILALDDSKMPMEARLKLERDAQIMIKMLQKSFGITNKNTANKKKSTKDKEQTSKVDHFISDSLTFDHNKEEGRFAKAAKDIQLGCYLIQEKPYASCLLNNYSQTHCQNCFKRTNVPIACFNCADIVSKLFCYLTLSLTNMYVPYADRCFVLRAAETLLVKRFTNSSAESCKLYGIREHR